MLNVFVTVVGADQEEQVTVRVLIHSDEINHQALQKQYGVRRTFGKKGFTADVNKEQLKALQNNKFITVSVVEQYHILGKPSKGGTPTNIRYTPNDQTPWGIQVLYNESVITATYGGGGIPVAILDTGVYNHLDLEANIAQCNDFTARKNPTVVGSCKDDNGHGTHVAGTVLANGGIDGKGIYGIAPEAKLWAYKVLDRNGSGYVDDIAYAIRYAADQTNGKPLIISMSLGSSVNSTLIQEAINYASEKGVLIIAAAGNEGYNPNTISYPAALSNVVAVAALENVIENGTYRVADFSSRGNLETGLNEIIEERDVEVAAPGRAVESTWIDGGYRTISGTSMAAPHIAGLAAKIWANNPTLTYDQVRLEIQNRAKTNDILSGYYTNEKSDIGSGFGLPTVQ